MSEKKKNPLVFAKVDSDFFERMHERMTQNIFDDFISAREECNQEKQEPLINFRRSLALTRNYNRMILCSLDFVENDIDRCKEILRCANEKLPLSFLEELIEKAKIELLGCFLSPQLTKYIHEELLLVSIDYKYMHNEFLQSVRKGYFKMSDLRVKGEGAFLKKAYSLLGLLDTFFEDEPEDETEDEPEGSSTNEPYSGLQHFDRQLFCKLVNASKVDEQRFDEYSKEYTQRICDKYSLYWAEKVRQRWGHGRPDLTTKSSKDVKSLTKVRKQIIPKMPKEEQQKLNEYIETHFSNFY